MPELISIADRLELEQLNEDNFDARATIRRMPTAGVRTGLGVTLTPTIVGTDVPCRVAPATGLAEIPVGPQVTAVSHRLVSFTKGQDVIARDQLEVELGTLENGVWTGSGVVITLEVVGPFGPHSIEVMRLVLCEMQGSPS